MAAELTETTRLFARTVAGIEPEWLERLGAHLLKRSQSEPHWEKKPAQVVAHGARDAVRAAGLCQPARALRADRPEVESRRIFIRQALVEGDWDTRAPFFQHNRGLVREIEKLEHKSRRPDVLVDDELIFAFYDSLVPEDMHNGAASTPGAREAERDEPEAAVPQARRPDAPRGGRASPPSSFRTQIEIAGRTFALEYLHEPGRAARRRHDDGAADRAQPGRRGPLRLAGAGAREGEGAAAREVAAAEAAPPARAARRSLRREFVAAVPPGDVPLAQAIARYARASCNLVVPLDGFRPETLPAHLSMNFRVVDEHGRQLGMGRNLAQLRAELGEKAGRAVRRKSRGPEAAQTGLTDWSFGELEEIMEMKRGAQTLVGYPGAGRSRRQRSTSRCSTRRRRRGRAHRAGLRRSSCCS